MSGTGEAGVYSFSIAMKNILVCDGVKDVGSGSTLSRFKSWS